MVGIGGGKQSPESGGCLLSSVTPLPSHVNTPAGADAGTSAEHGGAALHGGPNLGLSLSHKPSRMSPTLKIALGGSLVSVKGGESRVKPKRESASRGTVKGMSAQSRKRLFDWLNSIERAAVSGALFATLTYPSEWPSDWQRWKRDLECILTRLNRKYPTLCGVWKLEFQRRGAPHFHLLFFGVDAIDREWLSRAWFEVVGSGDEKHLAAGTQVNRVRDFRGVMAYAAKYVGKLSESSESTGRVWGVFNRELMPVHWCVVVLAWREFFNVRRLLRRWVIRNSKRKVRYRSSTTAGVTAYLSSDAGLRIAMLKGGD